MDPHAVSSPNGGNGHHGDGGITATGPTASHNAAVERVWELLGGDERAIVVDSPPGAGKSTLVREIARRLVALGEQVPVVVQTNDQADDLTIALAAEVAPLGATIGRLHSTDWSPPDPWPANVVNSRQVPALIGCNVVVATAAKWGYVKPEERTWEIGIVDEAYQMSSAALVRVAALFERLLLVGDPGQLAPFTVADERVVRSMATWPLDTAAGTVLRNHPETPVVPLPVSWRLPPHTAGVVASSFYARPFTAGVEPGVRRLALPLAAVNDALDRVLRIAADNGWSLLELPAAYLPRTDPTAVAVIVDVVRRLVGARASTMDESGSRPLGAGGVAVGVVHRDQRAHLRAGLDAVGLHGVVVDTANRLQGRQFEVVIAWHPLSGRRDASAFHLESGRLCVLASRHRQACIVVARAGIAEQLAAYPAGEPVWLGVDTPHVDGWEANLTFLEHLERFRVSVPTT